MPLDAEGAGAVTPRPSLGCGVLYLLSLLEELEDSYVRRAVCRLHGELAAGAGPRLVRLPDVVVLVEGRVVGEAASSSRHGLLDRIYRIARVAGDLLRNGEVRRKDVQTLVAREAEVDRHGEAAVSSVVVGIGGRAVDRRGTDPESVGRSRRAAHGHGAIDQVAGTCTVGDTSLRVARGLLRYVGWQAKRRRRGVPNRHGEGGGGSLVARSILSRAGDRGFAQRKGVGRSWRAGCGSVAVDCVGCPRRGVANGGAVGTSGLRGNVAVRRDNRSGGVYDRHGEATGSGVSSGIGGQHSTV